MILWKKETNFSITPRNYVTTENAPLDTDSWQWFVSSYYIIEPIFAN